MKTIVLFATLLVAGAAIAGSPRGGPVPMERLTEELALDAAQVPQVEQILNATRERVKALHDSENTERADRRSAMQAIHEDTRQQLRSVLNDEQMAKFDEMHQRRKERHEQHRKEKQDKADQEV